MFTEQTLGIKQDGTSTIEILTALNRMQLVEAIAIRMSNQESKLVVDEIDGLRIQFNWNYRKMEDRVRVVGEIVLDIDEQLKLLFSH
jgi:hypothetical protein